MAWKAQQVYPVPYQWRRVSTAFGAAVALTVLGRVIDPPLAAAIAIVAAYPLVLLPLGFYLKSSGACASLRCRPGDRRRHSHRPPRASRGRVLGHRPGQTPRGQRYNTGRVTGRDGYDEGLRLYRLLRELQPRVAVETGVCNGVSTAFLLLALEDNGEGALHSIDLPEVAGEEYEEGRSGTARAAR